MNQMPGGMQRTGVSPDRREARDGNGPKGRPVRKDGRRQASEPHADSERDALEAQSPAAERDPVDGRDPAEVGDSGGGDYRALFEASPVATAVSRADGTQRGNAAYRSLFGQRRLDDVLGRERPGACEPASAESGGSAGAAGQLGGIAREAADSSGARAHRPDGTPLPCGVAVSQLELPDGPAELVCFYSIAERKPSRARQEEAKASLRSLAKHLLHAREEERKKVAREIHDELGQSLTALKMELQWIEKHVEPRSSPVLEKLRGVVGLVGQTIQMVHRIASELRPGILDDLGLAAAIEWLGGDFSRRKGIPCGVDIATPVSCIAGRSATALFRIVQEALNNIANHSCATAASVELWEEDRVLYIRVRDDGIGITAEQATAPMSFGLIGIRERVQDLAGHLTITGRPGRGTTLMVTIPLPREGALS